MNALVGGVVCENVAQRDFVLADLIIASGSDFNSVLEVVEDHEVREWLIVHQACIYINFATFVRYTC